MRVNTKAGTTQRHEGGKESTKVQPDQNRTQVKQKREATKLSMSWKMCLYFLGTFQLNLASTLTIEVEGRTFRDFFVFIFKL